jgi:hypothetical protein
MRRTGKEKRRPKIVNSGEQQVAHPALLENEQPEYADIRISASTYRLGLMLIFIKYRLVNTR